jgi:MYXO-CTERM domain-containing protein
VDWNLRGGAGTNDLYIEIAGTPVVQLGNYIVGIQDSDGTPVCARVLDREYTMQGASVIFADEMGCAATPWPTAGIAVLQNRQQTPVSTREYDASGVCGEGYQPVGGVWMWSTPGPGRPPGAAVVRSLAFGQGLPQPTATEQAPEEPEQPEGESPPICGAQPVAVLVLGAVVLARRRRRRGADE